MNYKVFFINDANKNFKGDLLGFDLVFELIQKFNKQIYLLVDDRVQQFRIKRCLGISTT